MLARIVLSVMLFSFVGCASNSGAPMDEHAAHLSNSTYTVKRGDTLYSIAFRSGMDFRKVAAANGVLPPYTIYPGQLIFLTEENPARPISVSPPVSESRPTYPPTATPAPVPRPVPVPAPAASHGS